MAVSFIGNYFTGNVVDSHINAIQWCEGLQIIGNQFQTEPATADIEFGATTVTNSIEGGNYYGPLRATQSIITSLASGTGLSRLQSHGALRVEHATPLIELRELDAGTNEKNWDIVSVSGQLRFRAANDADTGWTNFITVDRSGTDVTAVNFPATDLTVGGALTPTTFQVPTSTTAALADVANAINTGVGKIEGTMVFNTTTNKPVWAVGNADADVWVDATGSTAHSPV